MSYDFSPFGDLSSIPGDPAEVSALGTRYANTVIEIDKAAQSLTTIRNNVDGNWEGLAGPHFRDKAGDLSSRVTQARGRYEAAGKALTQFSTDLDNAQLAAAVAAKAGRDAQATMSANTAQPEPGPNDPPETDAQTTDRQNRKTAYGNASSDYATAKTAFEKAVSEWHDAGKTAASTLNGADQHDGLKDSWWYDHWEEIKTILEIVAIVVAVIVVVALVLSCPFLLALLPEALGAFLTGAFAAGTTAGLITSGIVTTGMYVGGGLALASLGWDIYGKASGQDVTTSNLVWDSVGVVLSGGGIALSKFTDIGAVTDGIGDASSTTAATDASDQILQSILRDPDFDPAALARVNAAYDAVSTYTKASVETTLAAAKPSMTQVLQFGLKDSTEFAKLTSMAKFDPDAVAAALKDGSTLPTLQHLAETATKPHEYLARLHTLEKLAGVGDSDPTASISSSVQQHVATATR